jgi:hypothetical protein
MKVSIEYIISFLDKNTDEGIATYDVRTDTTNEALLDFISIDNRANMTAYEHDLLLGILESLKLEEKISFCNLLMGDYEIVSIERITKEMIYPRE